MSRTRALHLAVVALVAAAFACNKPDAGSGAGGGEDSVAAPAAVAPPACGTLVYALGEGGEHGRSQLARLDLAPGSTPEVFAFESLDAELPRSRYPAALSPDGTKLLILASAPSPSGKTRDRFELLELDSDGPPTPLATPSDVVLRNPSWAPDGSFIVFESNAESFRDLYRYDFAGASTLRLTDNAEGNFEPAVSPDGQSIAFVSSRDGDAEIYVMSADGGSPRRLTTSPGDDTAPQWSPKGDELAFVSARERGRGIDVFVRAMGEGSSAKASPLVAAREAPILARDLAWSPTGSKLAFTELSPKAGEAAVVVVDRATGARVVETALAGVEEQPAWSPDGTQVVFARGGHERSDLLRILVDPPGSTPIAATAGAGIAWLPRWTIAAGQGCARVRPPLDPAASSGQG